MSSQLDLFEETLEKKIYRMEKWMGRLQKELWFLKEVYLMSKGSCPVRQSSKIQQMEMFR